MRVYIGIDWSEQKHAVCYMNEAGAVILERVIGHSPEGLLQFAEDWKALGLSGQETLIGLETAHNLLIDFLLDRGYGPISVLPPTLVKSSQGRYAQGGAKDDRRDAQLIADILRTDHGRLHIWQPDRLLTRQIQLESRNVIHLTHMITRQTNHLRAMLVRYYPAALQIFSSLDSPVCLAFLSAYPTPQKAQALSYAEFCAFLREHHHTQKRVWPKSYANLMTEYPEAAPDTRQLYAERIPELVDMLLPFVQARTKAIQRLKTFFAQHPDAQIFAALPGVGDFLAPALLGKLGDDRQRFPSALVLQAIAGTCPVTERSGRSKTTRFRRACDRDFRYIAQQWARKAIAQSDWAATYYKVLLRRNIPKNDATRRVANRLLAILWKLWQSHRSYDEAFLLRQRLERAKPKPQA